MSPVNLVITGVGGQGVLLVTRVLAEAAVDMGLGVIVSEVHGMAQRGGSVVSSVRFGEAFGPLVGQGAADAVLALEPMEALRVADRACPDTVIVVATRAVPPLAVVLGKEPYPPVDGIFKELMSVSRHVYSIEADRIADSLGAPVVHNVVSMGALLSTGVLPLEMEAVRRRLSANVPEQTVEVNTQALDMGYQLASQQVGSFT